MFITSAVLVMDLLGVDLDPLTPTRENGSAVRFKGAGALDDDAYMGGGGGDDDARVAQLERELSDLDAARASVAAGGALSASAADALARAQQLGRGGGGAGAAGGAGAGAGGRSGASTLTRKETLATGERSVACTGRPASSVSVSVCASEASEESGTSSVAWPRKAGRRRFPTNGGIDRNISPSDNLKSSQTGGLVS